MAFTQQPLHLSDQPQINYLRRFSNFKHSLQSNNDVVNVPVSNKIQANDIKEVLLESAKGAVLLSTEQKPIEVKREQEQKNQKNQSLEKILNTFDRVNNLRAENDEKQAQSTGQNKQLNVSQAQVLKQSKKDQQKVKNPKSKQNNKHMNHSHQEQQQIIEQVPIFNEDFPSLSDFKNDHFKSGQNP